MPHPYWATPHHNWATPHPNWATPHHNWAMPHHNWATPHHNWATPHYNWATLHQNWATPHPNLATTHNSYLSRTIPFYVAPFFSTPHPKTYAHLPCSSGRCFDRKIVSGSRSRSRDPYLLEPDPDLCVKNLIYTIKCRHSEPRNQGQIRIMDSESR